MRLRREAKSELTRSIIVRGQEESSEAKISISNEPAEKIKTISGF